MTNDSQQPTVHNISLVPATSSVVSVVCRICYDGDKEEALIAPCDCKGTIGFVHQACLENWLAESNSTTCELCHYIFNIERAPKYNSSQSIWFWCKYSSQSPIPVRNDVIACSIITPLCVVLSYVCLLSSEYYSQLKYSQEPAARWTSMCLLCMIGIMLLGYYTWVYAVIRMHGRRWYYWWQRTCTVRLILPPERTNKVSVVSLQIVNERLLEGDSAVEIVHVNNNNANANEMSGTDDSIV